jgi:hypothetical protein
MQFRNSHGITTIETNLTDESLAAAEQLLAGSCASGAHLHLLDDDDNLIAGYSGSAAQLLGEVRALRREA